MDRIARVFVSSTWLDLKPERLAVEKALQRMKQTKLNGMEYFGSRDGTTRQVSLDEVDRSDVYVGIIGGRYGSGITEEEYRRASEKKLPRFIYFKDEEHIMAAERDFEVEKQSRLVTWKVDLHTAHAIGTEPFVSPDDLAARVTADLSNWFLDCYGSKLYVDGVGSLPFDYVGRIENFLSEYLGTAKAPVLFGGRERDLGVLNTWLEAPSAPPYFLMAAPAGRGKSALLVRWTRQVLARANIALVFIPISIRFRTNLSGVTFSTLAARLAQIHGEKIPDTPSTSVETWRGLVTEYLRRPLPNGEKLLVVLDGLDEAADWEVGPDLFPLPPPDHVRVVVSARYRAGDADATDWLRRLGWDGYDLARSYDLDNLTREGVARVLETMGLLLAQWGAEIDIVSELYRLTDGDPLLMKLFVENLWSHIEVVGSLKPEVLRKLKPGLKGYFDRWWDDQHKLWGKESPLKERAVQTLLCALSCSLGPLDQEGLMHLTNLSSWDLREALKPLDRLIVGNGEVHGYTFSHPRLGDYFMHELSRSEQQAWQQRFLDWGQTTIRALEQGTLAPARAPAYIVQYYGAHLEQAHASAEALLTLVCQGWSQAWEAFEGSYAGFLSDVERAWKAAVHENKQAIAKGDVASCIGAEIRCALVWTSINSLALNLPVELIVQLVKYQKWTFQQGLIYARQNPNLFIRNNILLRLANETDIPADLLEQAVVEALAAARALDDQEIGTDVNRAELLAELAPYMPQQERTLALDQALAAAQGLEWPWERSGPLTTLAPHKPEAVFAAARELSDDSFRASVLEALVPYQPEAVLAASQEIQDQYCVATVLTALAQHASEQDRELLLDQAWAAAQRIDYRYGGAEVLATLAPYRPEAVFAATQKFDEDWDRATVLVALAPYQPESVFAAASELDAIKARAKVLAALVQHVPRQVQSVVLNQAFEAARAIDSESDQVPILAVLAAYQPEIVLAAARELQNHDARAMVLASLAPHVSEQERELVLDQAWSAARVLNDIEARARVLTVLAPYVSQQERELVFDQAWVAAQALTDSEARAKVLIALASHRPEDVLAAAQTLHHSTACAEVLAALAPYRSEAVFAAAKELDDSKAYAKVLTALAPHRPEDVLSATHDLATPLLRAEVFEALAPYRPDAVLVAAQALDDSEVCALVLTALAAHRPEAVLAATQKLATNHGRKQVLAALAPHKPEAVLTAARQLQDHYWRATVLVALVPHVSQQERELVLDEAWAAARESKGPYELPRALASLAPYRAEWVLAATPELSNNWSRTHVLAALAPYKPEAVLATAQALDISFQCLEVLEAIAPHLGTISLHHLYSFWHSTLRNLSIDTRKNLMTNLSSPVSISVIEKLGQKHALEGMLHAAQDVTIWWP